MNDFDKTRLYADIADRDDVIEQQQARIAELEQREQELIATVERQNALLAEHFEEWEKDTGKWDEFDWHDRVARCLHATPQQNLNAVKREVAIEAFIDGSTDAAAFISQQLDLGKTDIDLDAGAAADKYVKTKYPSDKDDES